MDAYVLAEHAKQFNDITAALIELEGMKAENRKREHEGLSPAYGEEAFQQLLITYELGCNSSMEKYRRFF